ncbi:hypothetical protein EDB84DRAFT_299813 [Lactarius hengduanensis]|nr:hypothetical protein EDB84DRAFT_299813 [Lactarius hengduanensis]
MHSQSVVDSSKRNRVARRGVYMYVLLVLVQQMYLYASPCVRSLVTHFQSACGQYIRSENLAGKPHVGATTTLEVTLLFVYPSVAPRVIMMAHADGRKELQKLFRDLSSFPLLALLAPLPGCTSLSSWPPSSHSIRAKNRSPPLSRFTIRSRRRRCCPLLQSSDNVTFRVHGAILSMASPVFETMFLIARARLL